MNPNPKYYIRKKIASNTTAFMFDSVDSYYKFISDVNGVAVGNARQAFDYMNTPSYLQSRINRGVMWYGTTDANKVTSNLTTYLFNNELQSFLNSFSQQNITLDIVDIDQSKAIKFTDKEIGIFSFDLASLGLIPVVEYYSPLLDNVVSPNLVVGEKNQNNKTIFYHVFSAFIPMHKVIFDLEKNGYFSQILKRNVPKSELIEVITDDETYLAFPERQEIPKHIVQQRQQLDDNGRKKFSSTFKKSFIYIPTVEKPLPRVDIICGASYARGTNAQTEIIYSSMAAIAIAEKLSQAGVNYRIIACYACETSGRGSSKKIYPFVTLKKEGEPLDKNKIALMLSDGRQYRWQQFKAWVALQFDAGYDSNIDMSSIGNVIVNDDFNDIKRAYIEYLKAQDNPEDQLAAENPKSKISFAGALSEAQARSEYNRVITEISRI
jgi:hypothetical protein